MSITISNGGGGGGVVIETDPTALKLTGGTVLGTITVADTSVGTHASLVPNEVANDGISQSGCVTLQDWSGSYVKVDGTGIRFADGTVQTTAGGGGGSFTGGTVTTAVIADTGTGTQAILDPNFEGIARVYVGDSGSSVYTSVNQSGIQISNLGIGLSLNNYQITFSDGTVQTTAYTGGSLGNQQRLADAIAALVATPVVSYGTFGVTINLQWAFTSAYNNNSLYYEYPKFIDSMNGYGYPNTYSYTPYAYAANEYFGMSYVDSNGMVFISLNNISQYEPFTDAVTIVVTDNVNGGGYLDNTTTAYSFPCAIASYYPV